MAHIIIFGGHGKIALLTEPLLAERGDTVTAVIRNPDHAEAVRAAGATPVLADVEKLSVGALVNIIDGHSAVVWSAGAGGGNPERTYAVDRDAAIRTMDAARQVGTQRYVMVSYFGASPDHGVDPDNPFFPYAQAKAGADAHLRESALDWTILGPSGLTLEAPTGTIEVGSTNAGQVSRANVAQVIAETLINSDTVHRTITFNDGDTPIEQALNSLVI